MRDIYKKGDYVKYVGNGATTISLFREEDYAKIVDIFKHNEYWAVTLDLLKSKEKISCLVDVIRPIETNANHLKKLNFKEIKFDSSKYYQLEDIIISSVGIQTHHNSYFISGLCIGNTSIISPLDLAKFVIDGEFNIKSFFEIYPSVNNINQLFDYLKRFDNLIIDELEILNV